MGRSGTEEIQLSDVIKYAFAAGEVNQLLSAKFPGIHVNDFEFIDTTDKFSLVTSYISRMAPEKKYHEVNLIAGLPELKARYYGSVEHGAGYGF